MKAVLIMATGITKGRQVVIGFLIPDSFEGLSATEISWIYKIQQNLVLKHNLKPNCLSFYHM